MSTPNLDALASQSFVFDNAYVTQPVCTPARASIMTGLYPQTTGLAKNGIALDPHTKTIADMVSEDYIRAHFGKWHLGDDLVAQHGFEEWISLEGVHSLRQLSDGDELPDYYRFLRENGVEPPTFPAGYEIWAPGAELAEELAPASFLGQEASRFIRGHAAAGSGRPFMLYVTFFEPHPPYTGPLNGMYSPDEIDVGPAFLKRPQSSSLLNQLRADYYMAGNLNPLGVAGGDIHDTTTEAGWRKLRAQYFANVTLMDRAVGRIMSALEESGLADETIVVFTSEHGEMAGDHGMLEKRSLYEEASRVPLLVRAPGLEGGGTIVEGSIGQIDLVPTLLELLGEPLQDGLEGVSRVPVLRDGASLRDNDVFLQWNGVDDRDLGARTSTE
ncbi:MAG: sulfatase-like hydrolase/transferase [Chloroflexi bacterium]|nr:sulfatase-like hydrolase/transferase [Chloroflexota bacterium]